MTRPVRVGFLTYGLDRPLSGVTRVALELGRTLLERRDCEVVFLTPYERGPFVGEPGVRRAHLPGCRLLPGLMALGGPAIGLVARRVGLDVVHDPIGVAPFTLPRWAGAYKRLTTIHDAIAFEYPQGYPLVNNALHRVYVPLTLANTDRVATDSQHAAGKLRRYLRLPAARLRVVPLGVSPAYRVLPPREVAATVGELGLEPGYLLYVGAFKAHKNITGLVEAFARVRGELGGRRLVLVGPSQWRFTAVGEAIERLGLGGAVKVLGYVPETALPALYGGASAFVLPSLHEGFGLPVLEAMACGTPVVCSDASSLPEVAGDAALLVPPRDVDALAAAIRRVCTDEALAAQLRERGPRRAAAFTWQRTAAEYARLYAELAAA